LGAEGLLPHGASAGGRLVEGLKNDLREATSALDLHPPLVRLPLDIDLQLPAGDRPWQLAGRLQHLYQGEGLLQLSASRYRLADLLPLWIEHLCLHAGADPRAGKARYACRDRLATIMPIPPDEARERLDDLLDLYRQGLSRPLPFPPRTASAWMAAWKNKPNNKAMEKAALEGGTGDPAAAEMAAREQAAFKAARGEWNTASEYHTGEREAFHFRLLLNNRDWQPDETFAATARRILEPIHQYLESTR